MLEHYRKTFAKTQAVIAMATIAIFFGMHRQPTVTGGFFLMMQVGALVGAAWGTRLKRILGP